MIYYEVYSKLFLITKKKREKGVQWSKLEG